MLARFARHQRTWRAPRRRDAAGENELRTDAALASRAPGRITRPQPVPPCQEQGETTTRTSRASSAWRVPERALVRSLAHAPEVIEGWRVEYNGERTHSSLDDIPAEVFAANIAAEKAKPKLTATLSHSDLKIFREAGGVPQMELMATALTVGSGVFRNGVRGFLATLRCLW